MPRCSCCLARLRGFGQTWRREGRELSWGDCDWQGWPAAATRALRPICIYAYREPIISQIGNERNRAKGVPAGLVGVLIADEGCEEDCSRKELSKPSTLIAPGCCMMDCNCLNTISGSTKWLSSVLMAGGREVDVVVAVVVVVVATAAADTASTTPFEAALVCPFANGENN